jgi:hypothetical protein
MPGCGLCCYPGSKIGRKYDYYLRVKSRAEERLLKYRYPDSKPRRWVVERSHSWFSRYRKLLVSFEKTGARYLALLQLAAALIRWRQIIIISGEVISVAFDHGRAATGCLGRNSLDCAQRDKVARPACQVSLTLHVLAAIARLGRTRGLANDLANLPVKCLSVTLIPPDNRQSLR